MLVDGKKIASDSYIELAHRIQTLGRAPRLTIVTCAPNFETRKYLALKEKKATAIGITVQVQELPTTASTSDFISVIQKSISESDGIIVQLPLPPSVDVEAVTRAVPSTHDVDVLNTHTTHMLSPVVGAIQKILSIHSVAVHEKFVTVIGSGRLVGLPAYRWFVAQGAHVSVVTRDTGDIPHYTKNADIIVCGAGVPGLLRPDMVKDGAVVLDAGTSEDGGELRGDADPLCAEKTSLFTPVPGGIGPMTIALLLSNVVFCAEKSASSPHSET